MRIALSEGDPAGIGLDIIVKIASKGLLPPKSEIVFLGNVQHLKQRARDLRIPLRSHQYKASQIQFGLGLHDITRPEEKDYPVEPGVSDTRHSPLVLRALEVAALGCQDETFDAMVTLPLNKASVIQHLSSFVGQTEYLGELARGDPVMVLSAEDKLRVALVTTHLPLKHVAAQITLKKLLNVLCTLDSELRRKWGIRSPQIGVCGLNPHAGEQGWLGTEELTTINPAIEKAKEIGIQCSGPFPADAIFVPSKKPLGLKSQYGNFDLILAMYHDQGLIPIKQAFFDEAVNVTCGLNIIRTSPDHGTAFDKVGTGDFNMTPVISALNLAVKMAHQQSL